MNLCLKLDLFINLTIVSVINKGIWSSARILSLCARSPEFNSRNAPSKLSQQKVFELRSRHFVYRHDLVIGLILEMPHFSKLRQKVCEFYLANF